MAKAEAYPPKQRERAVELALEIGIDETVVKFKETYGRALRRDTLRKWLSNAGKASELSETRQRAIDAAGKEWERRREELKLSILTEAEAFLGDMRKGYERVVVDQKGGEHVIHTAPEPADRARLATGFGILFDKLQLSTGGPTSNQTVQNPSLTALVKQQNEANDTIKAGLLAAAAGAES
jgi:transposase-like protein